MWFNNAKGKFTTSGISIACTSSSSGKQHITNLKEKLMNQEYFQYFIQGTNNLFATFLGDKVTAGEPKLANWSEAPQFMSMISFSGEIQGTVLFHLPEKTALNITGEFIGMPVERDDDMVADTIAECINIIVGDAKSQFNNLKEPLTLSLPTVMISLTGSTLKIKDCQWYEIPFESKYGSLTLSISIKE